MFEVAFVSIGFAIFEIARLYFGYSPKKAFNEWVSATVSAIIVQLLIK